MANPINDGGPAFPQSDFTAYSTDGEGMSLRDYFAIHSPITMEMVVDVLETAYGPGSAAFTAASKASDSSLFLKTFAELQYAHADAMLAAREVKP